MQKKVVKSLLLMLVLVLSSMLIVACGSSGDKKDDKKKATCNGHEVFGQCYTKESSTEYGLYIRNNVDSDLVCVISLSKVGSSQQPATIPEIFTKKSVAAESIDLSLLTKFGASWGDSVNFDFDCQDNRQVKHSLQITLPVRGGEYGTVEIN